MTRRQHIDYGAPGQEDSTAALEQDVAWVVQQFTKLVQESSSVLNRPLGSKAISSEDQLEDWLSNREDPTHWDGQWQQRASVLGSERAKLELLRHDKEMQKRWFSQQ